MEREKGMTARENILSRLGANKETLLKSEGTDDKFELPDLSLLHPITYTDPVEKFINSAKTVSGAGVVEIKAGDNINEVIKQIYPDAKVIGSALPEVEAGINPDLVEKGSELMKVDVGVVKGCIGVAENGCIWIPQTMKERAIMFASEYLVIIISKSDIVNNMHEAYAKIEKTPEYFDTYKFGTFISGPSKTADIESALVYGAQAARGVTVLLTEP